MIVAAQLDEVRRLAAFLQDRCREANVDALAAIDLELALVEAANNVVEHGYEDLAPGKIELVVEIAGAEAVVTLIDSGAPIPDGLFNRCRTVEPTAIEGRGIGIVQSCVDHIEYGSAEGRNRLRLIKALPSA